MKLYPVIMPTDEPASCLFGREKVERLSAIAREALQLSAERSGIIVGELKKNENDVPIPFNGIHWSISHKSKCVVAVLSKDRVGIDIEEIRPRVERLFSRTASDEEWTRIGDKNWNNFYRYWTAKEAVLKADGFGIGGLPSCSVISVPDETHIDLKYKERHYKIEQFYFNNHIVSVVKGNSEIEWIVANNIIKPII